jgi:hypothetical protein
VNHQPVQCERSSAPADSVYVGKGWKAKFICPSCGRNCWQHLNFLGRRKVVCDGVKFTKVTDEHASLREVVKKCLGNPDLIDATMGGKGLLPMYEQMLVDLRSLVGNPDAEEYLQMTEGISVQQRIVEIEKHIRKITPK